MLTEQVLLVDFKKRVCVQTSETPITASVIQLSFRKI